jgi:hypothetical protein
VNGRNLTTPDELHVTGVAKERMVLYYTLEFWLLKGVRISFTGGAGL